METLFDQDLAPGEVKIERNFDPVNPKRDTTVITYGGKLSSRKLIQVRALLEGKAIIRRKEGDRG
jgi:hypothetical protein